MAMESGMAISREAISEVAKRHGVSEEEVRLEMERALLMTWGTEDGGAVQIQDEVFPEGLPEPERFISRLAEGMLSIFAAGE